jgi:hypothetical protein
VGPSEVPGARQPHRPGYPEPPARHPACGGTDAAAASVDLVLLAGLGASVVMRSARTRHDAVHEGSRRTRPAPVAAAQAVEVVEAQEGPAGSGPAGLMVRYDRLPSTYGRFFHRTRGLLVRKKF